MSSTAESAKNHSRLGLTSKEIDRTNQRRRLVDKLAAVVIKGGGVSVIIAVCLIFFYLLYEVVPLMEGASVEPVHEYQFEEGEGEVLLYSVEEQNTVGMRFKRTGVIEFFNVTTGELLSESTLTLMGQEITAVAINSQHSNLIAAGLDDGTVILFRHRYKESYPNGVKLITPSISYPFGEDPIEVVSSGDAIRNLAIRDTDSDMVIVASTEDSSLYISRYTKEENFFDESIVLEEEGIERLPSPRNKLKKLLLDPETRWLYLIQNKGIGVYDLKSADDIETDYIEYANKTTAAEFLLGGISLLVGDETGVVSQYFPVRDDFENYKLTKIRQFKVSDNPIVQIQPEQRRKGFVAVDSKGKVGFFNSTAEVEVFSSMLTDKPIAGIAMGPRANSLLVVEESGKAVFYDVKNEYPEVSFSVLWHKVWYESYEEPQYVWQSSSASNDFEPKFSLVPLAFGTLKAAFYAMLLAMPLAICGAIFTAQFMSPTIRTKVKPTIELMEALPTVILGFLAGLWLAPFVEEYLPGIFAILIIMPLLIVVFGFVWQQLPVGFRSLVPDGWQPVLLIPVVILAAVVSIQCSGPLEIAFFDGNMRSWLYDELNISFDQRNALVVGLAMGFAVIPTIFSIAEDALFAVPKSLIQGSLALGATPWQTLVRVVLPTASPGIFSAVMIGFGRAVGETMIVLMATGNTPLMEMNIFEGLRTLSANIAVEMPEAEVGSSHFRILFLTALVLFVFTFFFNTTAEIIRQRLREKYGSL